MFRRLAALHRSGITDVSPQSGARAVWWGNYGGVDVAVQLQSRDGAVEVGRGREKSW